MGFYVRFNFSSQTKVEVRYIPRSLLSTFCSSWSGVGSLRFNVNLTKNSTLMQEFVLVLGGLRALVGGLIGNNHTAVRPIVGASSVAHTGWATVGAVYGGI